MATAYQMIQQLRLETEEGAITPSRLADVLEAILEEGVANGSGTGGSGNTGGTTTPTNPGGTTGGNSWLDSGNGVGPDDYTKWTLKSGKTVGSGPNHIILKANGAFDIKAYVNRDRLQISADAYTPVTINTEKDIRIDLGAENSVSDVIDTFVIDLSGYDFCSFVNSSSSSYASENLPIMWANVKNLVITSSEKGIKHLNQFIYQQEYSDCLHVESLTLDIDTSEVTSFVAMFVNLVSVKVLILPRISMKSAQSYTNMLRNTQSLEAIKCPPSFRVWCLQHAEEIGLPDKFLSGGSGVWIFTDEP